MQFFTSSFICIVENGKCSRAGAPLELENNALFFTEFTESLIQSEITHDSVRNHTESPNNVRRITIVVSESAARRLDSKMTPLFLSCAVLLNANRADSTGKRTRLGFQAVAELSAQRSVMAMTVTVLLPHNDFFFNRIFFRAGAASRSRSEKFLQFLPPPPKQTPWRCP